MRDVGHHFGGVGASFSSYFGCLGGSGCQVRLGRCFGRRQEQVARLQEQVPRLQGQEQLPQEPGTLQRQVQLQGQEPRRDAAPRAASDRNI